MEQTIEQIIEQTYVHKNIKAICSNLSFKRLLLKLNVCLYLLVAFIGKLMAVQWYLHF